MSELYHYGILGMRWGIRRYQNKDGSLTPEGRKRLGLDKYDKDHGKDFAIKKGTIANRVISTSRYDEYADTNFFGSKKKADEYVKDKIDRESKFDRKYVSIDNVRNSGRDSGEDYYLSWFTDGGWSPNDAYVTKYALKNDINVASGKQVIDALIEEVGSQRISDLLKTGKSVKSLTLDYTRNKELFDRVNKKFIDKGYDAIEDINDLETDMPLIVFNAVKNLGNPKSIKSGKEAIDDYLKKHGNEVI